MPMNDAANVGQSYAGACKFPRAVQPLKHTEQFVHIFYVETCFVVADKDHHFILLVLLRADFDLCRMARTGILQRVRQQINKDLPQQDMENAVQVDKITPGQPGQAE